LADRSARFAYAFKAKGSETVTPEISPDGMMLRLLGIEMDSVTTIGDCLPYVPKETEYKP
jgi:hypothetical protein